MIIITGEPGQRGKCTDVSIMSLSDCYYSASVKTSSQSSSSQHLFDHLDVIILTIFIIITIHNIKYSRYYHQPGWRNHRCQLGTRSLKFPRWHHHYGATSLEIILSPKIPWSDTMTSMIQIHKPEYVFSFFQIPRSKNEDYGNNQIAWYYSESVHWYHQNHHYHHLAINFHHHFHPLHL